MKKQIKSSKWLVWLKAFLVLLAACILMAVMIAVSLYRQNTPSREESATVPETEQETVKLADEYELGYGLRLTGMVAASGNFPEDGSDDFLPNMFCITVQNTNTKMLQTARIRLTVNGQAYTFEMNSIPAGGTVRLYEKDRASAPVSFHSFDAECDYAIFFENTPTLGEDQLQLTVQEQGITVKNIGDENIEKEIIIYYKSVRNGVYVGGITYRVRLASLKAGDEATVYATHAHEGYSEVMFVEYGS